MKTIILIGHTNLENSKVSKTFLETNLKRGENAFDTIDVMSLYKNNNSINIKEQQEILEGYDKIIILSPINNLNLTYIMKRYIDDIFDKELALYPSTKMKNKPVQFILTCGYPIDAYAKTGLLKHDLNEIFLNHKIFFEISCPMKFENPLLIPASLTKEEIEIKSMEILNSI